MLDFGGVVLRTPFELLDELDLGLPWQGPFGGDSLWADLEVGVLTERGYWARRAAEVGLTAPELMHRLYDAPEERLIRSGAARLLADATAAGLRTAFLTNDLEAFHGRAWAKRLRILHAVDAVIDGSVTGVLKPNPAAYALALDQLGLPAQAVLFVDDLPVNLQGARRTGMAVELFDVTGPEASLARIRARLGLGLGLG